MVSRIACSDHHKNAQSLEDELKTQFSISMKTWETFNAYYDLMSWAIRNKDSNRQTNYPEVNN